MSGSSSIFTKLFGSVNWIAPPWCLRLQRSAQQQPGRFWSITILLLLFISGLVAAAYYYNQLPKPLQLVAKVSPPEIGYYDNDIEQPSSLTLQFSYEKSPQQLSNSNQDITELSPDIMPRVPSSNVSAAKLDLIGEVLTAGVTITPNISGKWLWQDDNTLSFTPNKAWPAGQHYTVSLDKAIFAPDIKLKHSQYDFSSAELTVALENLRFYQHPEQLKQRHIVGTLLFSHPVEIESINSLLSLTMREDGADKTAKAQALDYSLTIDKTGREVYIQSAALTLPEHEQYLTVNLKPGVLAQRPEQNATKTKVGISEQLLVPDQGSFLKVAQATFEIVTNPEQEPEQVLMLEFTDRIARAELTEKLKLYTLPKHPKRRSGNWMTSEINATVLSQAKALQWQLMATPEPHASQFSIKLDLPEGQDVFVQLPAGLASVAEFRLANEFRSIQSAPSYPKQAKIIGEGAVLSLSGEQTLQLLSRGLPGVKVKLHKLLPKQLNHYISQTNGDISQPYFESYNFNYENITAVFEKTFTLAASDPKQANYLALPLKPYLDKSGMGLFIIELTAFDPKRPDRYQSTLDKRMVLVTDLGLLVKHNADSSQQVFVMSVATGKPVANAKVELLGKNGVALYSDKTDNQGQVSFASSQHFNREREPVVYLVTQERDGITDSSFIPYQRYSNQLDYSKFNTSGDYYDAVEPDALNAYIFSDRGIYRPGEQIKLAAIIRQADMAVAQASKLPLKVLVEGPRGNTFWQKTFTLSGRGLHSFNVESEASSDTGRYSVSVRLLDKNGSIKRYLGSASFQLEEFVPDRLKITNTFNQDAKGWLSPNDLVAQIQLDNLFGTPAQQRLVSAKFELVPSRFNFEEFPDFKFVSLQQSDSARERIQENLVDQETDANGQANFSLPLEQYSGGTYRLVFEAEGFDSGGGRSVQLMQTALISPLSQLVGYKADGDLNYLKKQQARKVDFIAINNQLVQQSLPDLALKLIVKRAVSSLVKQNDGTYQYQSIEQRELVSETPYNIAKQGSHYLLPTDNAGDYELQLVDAKQQLLTKLSFSVIAAGNSQAMLEKNATLSVKLDKTDYKAGEWIEMNITAPYTGSGLITIESEKVHAFSWFTAETTSSIQRIQLPKHLEGNAYINVSYVRALDSEELFVSPLSYAVVPFNIDRSSRVLDISLKAPKEVRPGKAFNIEYKTSQPADILIFGVDEGILQVADYKLPDPLAHYLKKRALQVRSMQILDLLLPEFKLLRRHLAGIGGDVESIMVTGSRVMMDKNLNPFARRVEQPGVFWLGVLKADQKTNQAEVTLPQSFSGNIKLMAVAVGDATLGKTSQDLLVRGPFVVTPDVLTSAAPGDEFDVSVSVANGIKGSGPQAPVTVSLSAPEALQIIGDNQHKLIIGQGSEASARFRVKVLNHLGEATLTFTARYEKGSLVEQTERDISLSIRPATDYKNTITAGYAKSGQVTVSPSAQWHPELTAMSATASADPLVLAESFSDYLSQYPHGCTEQIVSQVFPWIGLVQQPAYQNQLPELQQKFAVLIDKLAERQQYDGGFNFWPGQQVSADAPSVYTMHFLIAAREQGLAVPYYMLEQGLEYLTTLARYKGANLYQARLRANAIYLLTRSGQVTSNYLVELHERLEKQHKQAWQSDITAVYMAASYQLLQKQDIAKGLIDQYRLGKRSAFEQQMHSSASQSRIASAHFANAAFQSQLSLDAQYIYLLAEHFLEKAQQLDGTAVLTLVQPMFDGNYNTISSAYAVLALSAYSQMQADLESPSLAFYQYIADKKQPINVADNKTALPKVNFSVAANKLLIESNSAVFYALNEAGYPDKLPTEASRNGLEVVRDYLDAKGNKVNTAKQGDELTVRLRIRSTNKQWHSNVAVIDLLPAGFSVIRSSLPREAGPWQADYVDVREDRIVYYASFGPQSTELNYKVKVTAAGNFVVPAVYAESMYDLTVNAHSVASEFTVSKPK
ncbi:alpha-2-macroglobulin [Rheinheimera sp. WS51]|uniref:alpha-2-macroglobulin n=1 Tax=Rheinheimera sp. WS51 TaxID=3425886 RepID=UPI003D90AB72